MNIIFDKKEAQEDIKLYHKKEKYKKLYVFILSIIFFIVLVLFVINIFKTHEFGFISFILIFLFSIIFVFLLLSDEIINPVLSAAAQYLIMTENKSILDIVIEPGVMDTKDVIFITESDTGDIERIKLCTAICIENTRIKEEIFDINKEIIFIPYYDVNLEEYVKK